MKALCNHLTVCGRLLLLGLCLTSCASTPQSAPDIGRAPPLLGFPDTSHGNVWDRLPTDSLAGDSIEHLVIAQGAGNHGYDSVTVDSSGAIEIVLEVLPRRYRWRTFRTQNPSLASSILRSGLLRQCRRLGGRYENDVTDGSQAFLWMQTPHRDHEVSCSNVFPPEFSRLWEYLRRTIQQTSASDWKESKGAPFAAYHAVAQRRAAAKAAAAASAEKEKKPLTLSIEVDGQIQSRVAKTRDGPKMTLKLHNQSSKPVRICVPGFLFQDIRVEDLAGEPVPPLPPPPPSKFGLNWVKTIKPGESLGDAFQLDSYFSPDVLMEYDQFKIYAERTPWLSPAQKRQLGVSEYDLKSNEVIVVRSWWGRCVRRLLQLFAEDEGGVTFKGLGGNLLVNHTQQATVRAAKQQRDA